MSGAEDQERIGEMPAHLAERRGVHRPTGAGARSGVGALCLLARIGALRMLAEGPAVIVQERLELAERSALERKRVKVVDRRQDSIIAEGSGAHRF